MEVERGERSSSPWKTCPAPLAPRYASSHLPPNHCQRDCVVSLTPHSASSTRWLRVPRTGTQDSPLRILQLPFQTPHAAWTPALPGSPAPRTSSSRPRGAQARVPEPALPPTLRCDPHPRTSPARLAKPQTSCAAASSESHPRSSPALAAATAAAARSNGPLHAPGRAAGGRGASRPGRRARGRRRGVPISSHQAASRAPGTPGEGRRGR